MRRLCVVLGVVAAIGTTVALTAGAALARALTWTSTHMVPVSARNPLGFTYDEYARVSGILAHLAWSRSGISPCTTAEGWQGNLHQPWRYANVANARRALLGEE
jgi:uncharacterized membrane protein YagU involved in acid resistance